MVSVLAAVAASLALADSAQATDYPVTTNADSGAGSLRAAVASANGNAGPDTVSFSGVSGTITLTTGQIPITGPVEISGPGPQVLTVNGNEASRIFSINSVGDPGVEISGLRFTGGQPGDCGCGGAIGNFQSQLVVENSILDHNDATWGGAIESYQSTLDVHTSILNDNTSSHDYGGGAIHSDAGDAHITDSMVLDNTTQGSGGGLALYGGKSTVEGTTVAGNHADDDDGGLSFYGGKATVLNSTITDNTTGGFGGGIGNSAKLMLQSSTVAGNEANKGGGIAGDSKKQSLTNSIVADNVATAKGPDMFGKFKASYSLIESRQKAKIKGKHNIFGKDPLLGDLGDYGGLTDTIPIDDDSRAVGRASKKSSPDLDQRGYERDNKPDIGAFELDAVP